MRTTLKNIESLAESLGLIANRPASCYLNILAKNNSVLYTAHSTQEAWA